MNTKNNMNNTGILTFKRFDENVLLNSTFNIDELFKIMLYDEDFVRFEIFNRDKKLLLTTNLNDQTADVIIVRPAKVGREEEIIWTNFNAYRNPMYIYGKKVEWRVNDRIFRTKKSAVAYAELINRNIATIINTFVDRR